MDSYFSVNRHKQIQMTKRYAHLCVSHKQKLIEKYFGEIYKFFFKGIKNPLYPIEFYEITYQNETY